MSNPNFSYGLFGYVPIIIVEMKKTALIILLLLFFSLFLPAQNTREVFAPFVSRLQATRENGSIKLTWRGSDDVDGNCIIYRHTEEINNSTFSGAVKVGEVTNEASSFVDYPEKTGTYYYAILLQNANGKIFKLFIPFRNITTKGITLDSLGTEMELAAEIRDINTQVQRDSILITFVPSKDDRELIVYRSISPIKQATDLAYAQTLRAFPSSRTSFQDFPVPGISYYYAILDSGLVKIGAISFKPGDNSTIIPASIPIGNRVGLPETTVSRNLPLPLLPLSLNIATGEQLDSPRPSTPVLPRELDLSTNKAVTTLLSQLPEEIEKELKPEILAEDKGTIISGGEEYTLKSILSKEFAEKRWLESEKLLKNFLSVHRSMEIERRARFYLGQVLYFQNKYREAFMQFVLIRDNLYIHVSPWIDRLFSILINV